jgi:hypothetical protein
LLLGDFAGDLDACLHNSLGEEPLGARRLMACGDGEGRTRIVNALRGLLGELVRVCPEERVVVLECHHDAPERIVVAKSERIT